MSDPLRNRPIAFVAGSQPGTRTLQTVPEPEHEPKVSTTGARCACTLCSSTMSARDFTAHSHGRRHQLALTKVDVHLRSLPDAVWSVPAVRRGEDTQGEGRVGSDKTASTAAPSNSLGVRSSVIPAVGSLALEKAMGSPCSVETGKQVRNKAKGSKKVKQPKGTVEGIAASHAPAVLDRPGCNDGQVGFFVDSFPGNVRSDRWPKNLMCNQDCGRCGEYMNHLADDIAALDPFSTPGEIISARTSITAEKSDPLQAFFAQYVPFKYNWLASSHDEFKRLCTFFGWPAHYLEPNHEERKKAWESFRIAMVETFNVTFGHDERDDEAWGRMCVLVDMQNVPESLEARRQAMINTHVNLSDLLDTTRHGTRVHVFASEEELRVYTKRTGRIFPREEAYAGGLLKYLLREISGTYHGNRGKGGSSRRRRENPDDKKIKGAGARGAMGRG